jgi:TPR repeat protein
MKLFPDNALIGYKAATILLCAMSWCGASGQTSQQSTTGKQNVTEKVAGTNYPKVMHFCAAGCSKGNGATLTWESGRYVEHAGGKNGATYTVDKFTKDSVVLLRVDYGRFPGRATLTGQLSEDGESIINGKVQWTYHPCCGLTSGVFRAAWGAVINTVPGGAGGRPPAPLGEQAANRNQPPPPANTSANPPQYAYAKRPQKDESQPKETGPAKSATVNPSSAGSPNVEAAKPSVAGAVTAQIPLGKKSAHNINGVWEADFGAPGTENYHHEKILVYQLRNAIQFLNIEGRRYVRPGTQFLIATDMLDSLPTTTKAGVLAPNGKGMVELYASTLTVEDAEHLHIGNEPKFHRTSLREVEDIECQDGNPQHISALDAYYRAMAFFDMKDKQTGDCWYHIAAEQGHARSQAAYAYALRMGQIAGKPNYFEARKWAQWSADQNDAYGENELGVAIAKTEPFVGQARGQEIADRAFMHDPSRIYNGDQTGVATPSVPVIVPDKTLNGTGNRVCDVDKDLHVLPAGALSFAKTNYANKNYGTAACWLYVSAVQGNPTAALSLGIVQHYGISVKRDDGQAFIWIRRAADADLVMAEEVVAHCYEFGVGTRKNPELANLWRNQMKDQVQLAKMLMAQRRKEAAEEAREAASAQFLMGFLNLGPLTHADRVEQYQSQGMSYSDAESRVNADEDDAAFWARMRSNQGF